MSIVLPTDGEAPVQQSQGKAALLEKLQNNTAKVAVIGMGYVGLPLAVCISKVGLEVLGIDVNPERVHQINLGKSYINDVTSEELSPLVEEGKIKGYCEFDVLSDADVIVICVPTPLTKNRDPNITYIQNSTEQIAKYLRPGQLITLESTTYPGTTEDVMLPILKASGHKVGEDFFLAYSPERVDPGNARYTTHNTNKVVGGYTQNCIDVATAFYKKSIINVIPVSSPGCAEMVKVFENTFRAVNIALVNELAILCDKMGLNVWEVVDAVGTKPFGIMSFYPGPGVGGHCIPIDPFYLTWKAREFNFHTRFIELAGEINNFMPEFVREKTIRALGYQGKSLRGANILLCGIAYKKDLGDFRHSPGMDLMNLLKKDGAIVTYNDPHVPSFVDDDGNHLESLPLNETTLSEIDCVIVITNHSDYDFDYIVEHSRQIVDTRNACKDVTSNRDRIILL